MVKGGQMKKKKKSSKNKKLDILKLFVPLIITILCGISVSLVVNLPQGEKHRQA